MEIDGILKRVDSIFGVPPRVPAETSALPGGPYGQLAEMIARQRDIKPGPTRLGRPVLELVTGGKD